MLLLILPSKTPFAALKGSRLIRRQARQQLGMQSNGRNGGEDVKRREKGKRARRRRGNGGLM